jgi:hypothetical protein
VQDRGLAAYIAELIGTLFLVFVIGTVITLYLSTSPDAQVGSDFAVIGLTHAFVLFFLIISFGVILTGMSPARFDPIQRTNRDKFGHIEHIAEFPGVKQFRIENFSGIGYADFLETFFQFEDLIQCRFAGPSREVESGTFGFRLKTRKLRPRITFSDCDLTWLWGALCSTGSVLRERRDPSRVSTRNPSGDARTAASSRRPDPTTPRGGRITIGRRRYEPSAKRPPISQRRSVSPGIGTTDSDPRKRPSGSK